MWMLHDRSRRLGRTFGKRAPLKRRTSFLLSVAVVALFVALVVLSRDVGQVLYALLR
jgi:hypothetical protein